MRTASLTALAALSMLSLLAAGCGAGAVQQIPISLRYTPVLDLPPATDTKTVAIGKFQDLRTNHPAGVVGERLRVNGEVDHFHPRDGIPKAVANVVRGYFAARGTRTTPTDWDGTPARLWSQPGTLAVAGRIVQLWFESRDFLTQGRASSVLHLVLVVGSPKTGTIITKSIQIEPTERSNVFFETKDAEKWINRTLSEALDRFMPDLERRLGG